MGNKRGRSNLTPKKKGGNSAPAQTNHFPSGHRPVTTDLIPPRGAADTTKAAFLAASTYHSGPLPDPKTLDGYNRIVPDAAERIIAMAERQADHRHRLERHVIRWGTFKSILGMLFAFALAVGTIGGGIYLVANGRDAGGVTAIVTALAALTGVFVYGQRRQGKELTQKREEQLPLPFK
jgi:uncharacterized membrane protein